MVSLTHDTSQALLKRLNNDTSPIQHVVVEQTTPQYRRERLTYIFSRFDIDASGSVDSRELFELGKAR